MTYRGRFAPSPTGPLHFGSLLAAVASWCDARAVGGQWLLRIEDIDQPRSRPEAVGHIFQALETYGLTWDGTVVYQSQRLALYQAALQQLQDQGDIFWCYCSRSDLAGHAIYTGRCRHHQQPEAQNTRPAAARLRVPCPCVIRFYDRVCGWQQEDVGQHVGDFVLLRRDGYFAYQLAVVVDDADQGISHIVRGADLLDNTARQCYLQQRLGFTTPTYLHIPLARNAQGEKLSKQTGAAALSLTHPEPILWQALAALGQQPPLSLQQAPVNELLTWAIAHWQIAQIPNPLTPMAPPE